MIDDVSALGRSDPKVRPIIEVYYTVALMPLEGTFRCFLFSARSIDARLNVSVSWGGLRRTVFGRTR